MIHKYNYDKPHRCPNCHAVTDGENKCKWNVVTCCVCSKQFTRFPRIARFLPKVGVVCTDTPHPKLNRKIG